MQPMMTPHIAEADRHAQTIHNNVRYTPQILPSTSLKPTIYSFQKPVILRCRYYRYIGSRYCKAGHTILETNVAPCQLPSLPFTSLFQASPSYNVCLSLSTPPSHKTSTQLHSQAPSPPYPAPPFLRTTLYTQPSSPKPWASEQFTLVADHPTPRTARAECPARCPSQSHTKPSAISLYHIILHRTDERRRTAVTRDGNDNLERSELCGKRCKLRQRVRLAAYRGRIVEGVEWCISLAGK